MRLNFLTRPQRLVPSITVVRAGLIAFLWMATAKPADKPFEVPPIEKFAHKQTSDGVTIAAEAYTTDEQTHTAFGKLNPWKYDILPVLVVIRNSSGHAIRLDRARFEYELPDHSRVSATPAADVKYARAPSRPKVGVGPLGNVRVGAGKMPLNVPEIEVRALSAKMIPAGETASGFVYFNTDVSSAAASLYIAGLSDPATGQELYYFEISIPSN